MSLYRIGWLRNCAPAASLRPPTPRRARVTALMSPAAGTRRVIHELQQSLGELSNRNRICQRDRELVNCPVGECARAARHAWIDFARRPRRKHASSPGPAYPPHFRLMSSR
ncbi:hypothetical protein EVAR_43519_1 [Eumeta japonica]|uniref:Uncharacterized protein n=1 Tax=Eumeta variegata TaxID=151549 RepID=A0A4C1YK11_EUMVA|nr:hypothetical protein EVAR_43519_1 [Eumeta japonica]